MIEAIADPPIMPGHLCLTSGAKRGLEMDAQSYGFKGHFSSELTPIVRALGRSTGHSTLTLLRGQAPDYRYAVHMAAPIVTEVAEIFDEPVDRPDRVAVNFARGIFSAYKDFEFQELRALSEWEQHKQFESLIAGIKHTKQ